jgi:ubiquinone biosynthesis protein
MINNRVYRFLRSMLTLMAGVSRYLWLMTRDRLPWVKPSEAAWRKANRKTGKAIYNLATTLRGGMVKFGQVVGSRADYFPPEFVEPLSGLHDQVPGRPLKQVRGFVERELGRPLDEIFATVDEQPIAAASLAQVHRAQLKDGTEVVIKVQYPEARKVFPIDLASMRRTVRIARWLNKSIDLRSVAQELSEFVTLELDFAREAESTERIREAFVGDDRVVIPRVHKNLSTDKILVLDFLPGRRIGDTEALVEMGIDLKSTAERVAGIYCTMIFEHGFFHGDPHPGNMLVASDGTIGLIDYGLAKELPEGFSEGVATMIVKTMSGDGAAALEAARSIGFEIGGQSPDEFRKLMLMFMGDYGQEDVMGILKESPLEHVPSHFAIIGRVFMLLNGLSHRLVPGERVIASVMAKTLMTVIARTQAKPPN